MDKLHGVLTAVALAAVVVGVHALEQANAWERKVHVAEARANTFQRSADSLEDVAHAAEVAGAHADTVRVTLTKLIPQTDSATHPDSTCGPSLAARDEVILVASNEIDALHRQTAAQMAALANLQSKANTLQAALDARPRTGVSLEVLHPSLHITVTAMVYPVQRVGLGVSYDLVRIKL